MTDAITLARPRPDLTLSGIADDIGLDLAELQAAVADLREVAEAVEAASKHREDIERRPHDDLVGRAAAALRTHQFEHLALVVLRDMVASGRHGWLTSVLEEMLVRSDAQFFKVGDVRDPEAVAGIHTRLRERRTTQRLTVGQLSEASGLPPTTLQNYLSGRQAPGAAALARLAVALETTADWLLFGDGGRDD